MTILTAWLIEYLGAKPYPVYVPANFTETQGIHTLSAWKAKRFHTKAEAEVFMKNPDECQPYSEPWAATEHSFSLQGQLEADTEKGL